jgi:hypothetical protein
MFILYSLKKAIFGRPEIIRVMGSSPFIATALLNKLSNLKISNYGTI